MFGGINGTKAYIGLAVIEEIVYLHAMGELFLGLDAHPMGKAIEILREKIRGHCQITICRVIFHIELCIERGGYFCVDHDVLLLRQGEKSSTQREDKYKKIMSFVNELKIIC